MIGSIGTLSVTHCVTSVSTVIGSETYVVRGNTQDVCALGRKES